MHRAKVAYGITFLPLMSPTALLKPLLQRSNRLAIMRNARTIELQSVYQSQARRKLTYYTVSHMIDHVPFEPAVKRSIILFLRKAQTYTMAALVRSMRRLAVAPHFRRTMPTLSYSAKADGMWLI